MERWQNKVAVVTGASSGIGSAIAKDLVNAGLVVVALARRMDRLCDLKAELPVARRQHFHVLKCDVSSKKSVNETFDWICSNLGGVDILVNNAAIGKEGPLSAIDPDLVQQVIQTNVMGVVYCTQRAFKSMKERNFDGHVVLINSLGGHKAGGLIPGSTPSENTYSNIYSPTKFSITAMNEVYRQEFNGLGTKIKVTSVSPGATDTELLPDRIRKMMQGRMLNVKDISDAVLYVIGTPPHVQVHEIQIKPIGSYF